MCDLLVGWSWPDSRVGLDGAPNKFWVVEGEWIHVGYGLPAPTSRGRSRWRLATVVGSCDDDLVRVSANLLNHLVLIECPEHVEGVR